MTDDNVLAQAGSTAPFFTIDIAHIDFPDWIIKFSIVSKLQSFIFIVFN